MGHYAKVLKGIVQTVIVADEEFFETFVDDSPGEWIQTSYNTRGGVHYNQDLTPSNTQEKALRKNYATIGYIYDKERDAFYEPQPFPSWTFDETTCYWIPPTPRPTNGIWVWNEEEQVWEALHG